MNQLPIPTRPSLGRRLAESLRATASSLVRHVADRDPTFKATFGLSLLISALLYTRSPLSNYIFDEQEALLANPYVNGRGLAFWEAFRRDFWGLAADRSIGSYRPLPNLIWRALWHVSTAPFLHHLVNVVVHALNAALLASFVFAVTRRRDHGWIAGGMFLSFAVLTEAVSGVVGIADVLGGLGVVAALHALRLSGWLLPLGVFLALFLGLLSKESVIVALPLVTWAALCLAPFLHARPRRVLRAGATLVFSLLALVAYTYLRRRFFPVASPESAAQLSSEWAPLRAFHAFLRWFAQPPLPHDPINNPLVGADLPHRISGAMRVYARGLGQLVFPWRLSGDYSFPAEPVPARLFGVESVLGGLALLLPPLVALGVWVSALFAERRDRAQRPATVSPGEVAPLGLGTRVRGLVAVGLLWVPVAYFPHSNIPVLLPTVRAERFWYLPAMGAVMLLAPLVPWLRHRFPSRRAAYALALWFGFQAAQARWHAFDYTDDLVFWRATKNSVGNSAKAHLNYSVMVGARGRLDERLAANQRALELAPRWAMAHIYLGDTLCRLHRVSDAWPSYVRGFELAPNDPNLIALALQCLWDEKHIEPHESELLSMADAHPGSWLAFLATDIVHHGKEHGGVQKKYRPRSYDGGPKGDKEDQDDGDD